MKQNKIKVFDIIKKYPIVIGIAFVALTMALVLGIKINERWSAIEPTVVTEDMGRTATVEGFPAASDTIRYLISAIQENDLDKAMRAFPIDERVLGVNSAKIINMEAEFSSSICPPSGSYSQYVPASSSEIAGQYAEDITTLQEALDWAEAGVSDIRILMPEQQLVGRYQKEMQEQSECWSADAMCEMAVEITYGDQIYMMPVTVVKYGDIWKVFRFGASLLENTSDYLSETDSSIYESLTDPEMEEEVWESFESSDEEDEVPVYTENPEQQLLPPNYFLASQVYSESPESAITEFSKYIEKEDITSALCYAYLEHEQLGSNPATVLVRQEKFARQIADMYYGILFDEKTEGVQTLESLGMTGEEIVAKINPVNIPYMDLKKIIHYGEDEYAAVYYYGREYYMVGFTMRESESGWQIEALEADSAGLHSGEVRKITEKEFEALEND